MTEYTWSSPGGVYVVPAGFQARFLSEFPDYRIRWSLQKGRWQIEQRCGRNVIPPIFIDEANDTLVRARDGYWLVMEFQPGDRMACPGIISLHPTQRCGWTLRVPTRESRETVCSICRSKGRDGRTMAAFWPFDECLLEHLRLSDPLRVLGGENGVQRMRSDADRQNAAILKEAERRQQDAATSIDAVDHRWLTGIASTSGLRRRVDHTTFR